MEIDDEEYFQKLYQLARKKLTSLQKDEHAYRKTQKYLFQKGYEIENIQKVLKKNISKVIAYPPIFLGNNKLNKIPALGLR